MDPVSESVDLDYLIQASRVVEAHQLACDRDIDQSDLKPLWDLVQEAKGLVQDDSDWTTIHSDPQIVTKYKVEPDTPFNTLRTEGKSEVPLFNVIGNLLSTIPFQ